MRVSMLDNLNLPDEFKEWYENLFERIKRIKEGGREVSLDNETKLFLKALTALSKARDKIEELEDKTVSTYLYTYKGYKVMLHKTKKGEYTATARHPTRITHYYLQTNFYKQQATARKNIKEKINYFHPLGVIK